MGSGTGVLSVVSSCPPLVSSLPVVLVSEVDPQLVRAMKMHPAKDLQEALTIAENLLGYPGTVTVIPEGISTIIG